MKVTSHRQYLSNCSSSQENERQKLGSILKFEKRERSYDDVYPHTLKNADNLSAKPKRSHHKQLFEKNFHKREELILHMSNLPSYLERGGKPQDKAFNIGVLDWRLLQKWQHGYPDTTNPCGMHLPSSSKIPSFISSEGSSSHQQTRAIRPPVPSHFNASPIKGKKTVEQSKTAVDEPMVGPMNRFSDQVCNLHSSESDNHESVGENQCKISGGHMEDICRTRFLSCYDQLNKLGLAKDLQLDRTGSTDIKNTNCPSEMKEKISFPRSKGNSVPSRKKNLENQESDSVQSNSAGNVVPEVKMGNSESTYMRSPSPTRRFSFGLRRNGKGSISDITSSVQYSAPERFSDSKTSCTLSCPFDTTSEKPRSKSSPLRRLLDPILKSKGIDHCRERNHSTTIKSSTRQSEPLVSRSLKAKLDLKGCRTEDYVVPKLTQKNVPSKTKALLQVAVKNSLPLFTFTVDNCSDILAATVKEISSKKALHKWVYTFFSFSEMKKKNMNWINKGTKDGNNGFIPNAMAQMNVSDVQYEDSNRQSNSAQSNVREFVLSSMCSKGGGKASDSMQNEELAAIVVKFPRKIHKREDFQEVQSCLNERDDKEFGFSYNDGSFGATVILPGGRHGVPSKGLGEPSPLIERWKTGGSCDCGGWDLGCRLRVLASRDNSNQRRYPTKSQSTIFKLFCQEEDEENKPLFILSPFEDGIFSVTFSSSLTLIQAFSIGIAVLSSRKMSVVPPDMFGTKVSEEMTLSKNTQVKLSDRELSTKYLSYPPLSPVGRV